MEFKVIYPVTRYATEAELRMFAADLIADGEIDGPEDEDIFELIEQMEDTGRITIERPHYTPREF